MKKYLWIILYLLICNFSIQAQPYTNFYSTIPFKFATYNDAPLYSSSNSIVGTVKARTFIGTPAIFYLERSNDRSFRWVQAYTNTEYTGYLSLDDLQQENSDCLPKNFTRKYNFPNYRIDKDPKGIQAVLIPAYYIEVLKTKNRYKLLEYEPKRIDFGDYEPPRQPWYFACPWPLSVEINGNFKLLFHLNDAPSFRFLIAQCKQNNSEYQLTCMPEKFSPDDDQNRLLMDNAYKKYFPAFTKLKQFELTCKFQNRRARFYNEGHMLLDLVLVDDLFYSQYEDFIRSGEVPKDMVIPKELLIPWQDDKAASTSTPASLASTGTANAGFTPTNTTTSNLRLRASASTGAAIITTIPQGIRVQVLQTGPAATIDGISSLWVQVKTEDGKTGWCFGGYLDPKP